MNKLLAIAALLTCSFNTYAACNFQRATTEAIGNEIDNRGGLTILDKNCNLLNKNNLALYITATSTVLDGISIGWASVSLMSTNNILSSANATNTIVNTSVASMDKAKDLMYESINEATAKLNFEKAVKDINQFESKIINSSKKNM